MRRIRSLEPPSLAMLHHSMPNLCNPTLVRIRLLRNCHQLSGSDAHIDQEKGAAYCARTVQIFGR